MAAVCSFSERRDKLSRRARAERQRCTRYLPDTKPCLGHPHARVVFGGQEHDQPGIELDPTGKVISLDVRRPKVGSQIAIYWTW